MDEAALRAAAGRLAGAEEAQRSAFEALAAAQVECANIDARIGAMAAERSAIVSRRAGGDRRDKEDGERLALLAADVEALRAEADAPRRGHRGRGAGARAGGHRPRRLLARADRQHNTVEKYNSRGDHQGEFALEGRQTKAANPNRKAIP